jgi:ParB-like chromosome segregation protein Spo0J
VSPVAVEPLAPAGGRLGSLTREGHAFIAIVGKGRLTTFRFRHPPGAAPVTASRRSMDGGPDPRHAAVGLSAAEVRPVQIAALGPQVAVRVDGINDEHVAVLAELPQQLPPIVVHRPTMRVVDGMHRLVAARARGEKEIQALFIDGDEVNALVLAVRLNVVHGLPLSRKDRRAAVRQLLEARPEWSDRRIAEVVGVSHRTVGAARWHLPGDAARSVRTVGRDGRVRPRDPSAERARAAEMMAARPDVSTRAIAREVGLSPATVRDVHRRQCEGSAVHRGVPLGHRSGASFGSVPTAATFADRIRVLRGDPALRYSLVGRALLQSLAATVNLVAAGDLIKAVPSHSQPMVAGLARDAARTWLWIAESLEAAAPEPGGMGADAAVSSCGTSSQPQG